MQYSSNQQTLCFYKYQQMIIIQGMSFLSEKSGECYIFYVLLLITYLWVEFVYTEPIYSGIQNQKSYLKGINWASTYYTKN